MNKHNILLDKINLSEGGKNVEVKTCPYLDGKCGEHAQCVKCEHNTPRRAVSQQKGEPYV